MNKLYIIGSTSVLAQSIAKLASEHYSVVFIGRSNPFQFEHYINYEGIENEASVEHLKALIIDDIKSTKQLESASLVILAGTSSKDWQESFLVNEYLPAKLSQDFAEHVTTAQLKNCSITLVGSTSAYQGAKLSYATTKASLTGVIHVLSKEYAHQVRINLILPSAFESNMIADWDDAKKETIAGSNLIGRLGSADDMAEAILFSVTNKFITNSTINMSGGTVHI